MAGIVRDCSQFLDEKAFRAEGKLWGFYFVANGALLVISFYPLIKYYCIYIQHQSKMIVQATADQGNFEDIPEEV